MKQIIFAPKKMPHTLKIESIEEDLQVIGWEREDLSAKTDGDDLKVDENGVLKVRGDGSLILYIPRAINLQVDSIGGDADIRAIGGAVHIDNVGGDLQMRSRHREKPGRAGAQDPDRYSGRRRHPGIGAAAGRGRCSP